MTKHWIGIVVSALLTSGCAPKVIETPGGAVECYSKKCVNEANAWTRQHNRQVEKEAKEERKRIQAEADRAAAIAKDPWRAYSVTQVKQLAKENRIALYTMQKHNGLLYVQGIDLDSLKRGVNLRGQPMVTGAIVEQPIRDPQVFSQSVGATWIAECRTGRLIDPMGGITDVNELLYILAANNASEMAPSKIWRVLCSFGTSNIEPDASGSEVGQPSSPSSAMPQSADL